MFVYLRLATAPDRAQDDIGDAVEHAGHPVVRIGVNEPYAICQARVSQLRRYFMQDWAEYTADR